MKEILDNDLLESLRLYLDERDERIMRFVRVEIYQQLRYRSGDSSHSFKGDVYNELFSTLLKILEKNLDQDFNEMSKIIDRYEISKNDMRNDHANESLYMEAYSILRDRNQYLMDTLSDRVFEILESLEQEY